MPTAGDPLRPVATDLDLDGAVARGAGCGLAVVLGLLFWLGCALAFITGFLVGRLST